MASGRRSAALDHLTAAARIGTLELPNRMVMAPMGVELVGGDGIANDDIIAYYEERARGGVGLILTEVAAWAYPRGATSEHQLGLSNDSFVPALRRLTTRVHDAGAKIAIQLVHHGKVSRLDTKQGRPIMVPSVPAWPGSLDMINDLSGDELMAMAAASGGGKPTYHVPDADELAGVVDEVAAAVVRARDAGFDGVEIHAAHGYLLSGFLSPQWNTRDDEYGGPIENRARLLCDVIAAAKREAGAEFPVWCRLDALEYRTPDGIVFDDVLVTAQLAVEAGSDAIHLSAYGDMTSGRAFVEGTLPDREAKHAALTARMKQAVDVPVIAVGRIQPHTGDEMIAHGKADLIGMGRQLLADPATASKVKQGRTDDIRPCINCYVCVAQPFFDQRVRCAVNPVLGHETELAAVERTTADRSRRLVVIGAGPAGMETARVAAIRGHQVTVIEAADHLGGALRFAALAYEPNLRLLDWYEHQMETLGVDVRLGTVADVEAVRALEPDVVVVATGAARERSALPGADQRHVLDGDDLRDLLTGSGDGSAMRKLSMPARFALRIGRRLGLTSDPGQLAHLSERYMPVGSRVTVIGGGLVGIELAEFLAERGRVVTVLEAGDKMALEMAHPRRWRVLGDLRDRDVVLENGVAGIEIGSTTVTYQVGDDTRTVDADTVVIATGLVADLSVVDEFRTAGFDPVVVGDCQGVGYLEGAILDGFRAGAAV